jgi:molybdate transport system substrate-binding protein
VKGWRAVVVLLALASAACQTYCLDTSVGIGVEEHPVAALAIAAAADLRYALDELMTGFKAGHPDVSITVSYGSSGNFYAQLANGAPFDLFLSADVEYPRRLVEAGIAEPDSVFHYAAGRLAVWVPASSPIDVARLGMLSLTADSVAHVAIANPEHAPYGRAAEAAMRSAGVLEQVRPKLVFGENISQTLQFIQSGAADAGVVAVSLAVAPQVSGSGRYWIVPADAHPRIEQAGAIMRAAKNRSAAESFRAFMLGAEARAILQRYGFDTDGK